MRPLKVFLIAGEPSATPLTKLKFQRQQVPDILYKKTSIFQKIKYFFKKIHP